METLTLELSNIEISFLDKVILDIPKLSVYQFDRIGIVGQNGSGKSTLLKLIKGELQPNKGTVNHQVDFGYFEQTEPPTVGTVDYQMLGRLAIPETAHDHLSGGEQTRLKLAQLFSTYYEGLLLDEPTTHLDQSGHQFLIEELKYYYGSLLLVSHDRYMLDELVNKIWEVKDGEVTEYTGNYSDYIEQKKLEKEQQQEQHEKYVKDKNRLLKAAEEKMKKAQKVTQASKKTSQKETKAKANLMFMTKSKDTSQKAIHKAAKALEQRVEQLEVVEAPERERSISFPQPASLQLHNKFPVMADRLTLKIEGKTLLDDVSFQFPLSQTIAITGDNGSGKSTLLRHILQSGEGLTISPKVEFGYYAQLSYHFQKEETVYSYIEERSVHEEKVIRAALHSMNFSGNDIKKDVRSLSGGERIRLILCQLFLGRYNVLVLDEPTNFLDVDCLNALEAFINGYAGTVLLVSHDRTFVKQVANQQYKIENQNLNLL
ncbi:Msr family ABC-F type ribosomal protection protein [Alkalihalobacillus sp. 1P02AB]|uniref:Msr family ABC-F type ribosomal protection protein n=1 Tax=Alkalihalobacillus sp. 1P02AB TaxID=3132260 RepID=UPI0039A4C1FE